MAKKKEELSGEMFLRLERKFQQKYASDKKMLADAAELADAMQMWMLHVWINCMKHAFKREKPRG